jgi:hypothetical protein
MGMSGVQLRGIEAIMRAYDNIKIVAWSVMYGKNINMKYIGTSFVEAREALRIFLEQLRDSQTTAVYTLNIYEDIPKDKKIRVSTESDYAFNFLVDDTEAPRFQRYRDVDRQLQELMDKNTKLEAKLLAMEEEEDDEPEGIGAIISGLAKDPAIMEWIKTKALGLADKLFTGTQNNNTKVIPMNHAAKIGGVTQDDPILINEDQQTKASQAIEILARLDPNLGDNLLKIAKIAENDPGKYAMFSKML